MIEYMIIHIKPRKLSYTYVAIDIVQKNLLGRSQ